MYTEIRNPPKGQQHRKEWRCSSDKNPRGLLNTAVSTGERRKAGGDAAHHAGDNVSVTQGSEAC